MAGPERIYIYHRPPNSADVESCKIRYLEATEKGAALCTTVTPDPLTLPIAKRGDAYVFNDGTHDVIIYDPTTEQHYILTKDAAGALHVEIFASAAAAINYLEEQRKPEVTKQESDNKEVFDGGIITVNIGGHNTTITEKEEALPAGTGGIPGKNGGNEFTGDGFDIGVGVNFPRLNRFWRWLSIFRLLIIDVARTTGTVNDPYTAISDQNGTFASTEVRVAPELQLDGILFAGDTWRVNPFFGVSTPYYRYRHFTSHAAWNGHSLPTDITVNEHRTFGSDVRLRFGLQVRATNWFTIGGEGYVNSSSVDDDVHFSQLDVGGRVLFELVNYTRTIEGTKTVVGDSHVNLTPVPPEIVARSTPPEQPEVGESVVLPPEPTFELGEKALFKTAESKLLPEGRKALDEIVEKIQEYYRQLRASNFPTDLPLYILVKGFADIRGGVAANQHLSEQRAKAIAEYLGKVIAKVRAEAKRKNVAADLPPAIHPRFKGYGETQPVDEQGQPSADLAKINNPKAWQQQRRAEIRVFSDPDELDKVQPKETVPEEVLKNDVTVAGQIETLLGTRTFYHPTSNTLNLVVPVQYTDGNAPTSTDTDKPFTKVYNKIVGDRRLANLFKQLSDNLAIQILLQPDVDAATEDVLLARENGARSKILVFGKWPAGPTSIDTMPANTTDPVAFVGEQITSHAEEMAADLKTLQEIQTNPVSLSDGSKLYTIPAILKNGHLSKTTRAILKAFAKGTIGSTPYYLELYLPPDDAKALGGTAAVQSVGNIIRRETKNPGVNLQLVRDQRLLAQILIVLPSPTNRDALHNEIFKVLWTRRPPP